MTTASPDPSQPARELGGLEAMLSIAWVRWLMYAVLIAALSTLPTVAGLHLWRAHQAQAYVEVEGRVRTSRVKWMGDDSQQAVIVIDYELDGYRGETTLVPALGVEGAEELGPNALVARYPAGATIPVFVDPEAPERATLTRRYDPWPNLGGALVLALVLAWVIRADRRRRCG